MFGPVPFFNVQGLVELLFEDSASSTANTNQYTFALGFGAAAGSRKLLAGIGYRSSGLITITSVTIGGIAAVQVAAFTVAAVANNFQFWGATVPTGTSGNVVVNLSGNAAQAGCGIYRARRVQSLIPTDTLAEIGTPASGNIDIEEGGGVIAGGMCLGAGGMTWTGVSEDDEYTPFGNAYGTASKVSVAGETLAVTLSGSAVSLFVAAALR